MNRDMDLVRQILLKIGQHEHGFAPRPLDIEGYSEEQIGYHLYLMGQAGLLNVTNVTHMGSQSPLAIASSMTWAGHEFLDAARSESIWNRAKQRIGESVGTVSVQVFTALLYALAKEKLGLPH